MSLITTLRDDLVAELQTLLPAEAIFPDWVPTIERQNLTSREIFISPEAHKTKLISRNCKQSTVVFIVGIAGPLGVNADATADAGDGLADSITDALLGKRLGSAMCTEVEQPMAISPDLWRQYSQFTTFLRITLVV